MSWERRARGTRYYTRSKKVGGRIVRQYVGCGVVGELAAAADAAARLEAQEEARRWQARRAQVESAGEMSRRFADSVERLSRAALVLAGYHQHHRGEWRKVREQGTEQS